MTDVTDSIANMRLLILSENEQFRVCHLQVVVSTLSIEILKKNFCANNMRFYQAENGEKA